MKLSSRVSTNIATVLLFFTSSMAHTQEPSWVRSRPVSADFYLGIGAAEKDRHTDYQFQAKLRALQDIASEISIDISAQTISEQTEKNANLTSEFVSNIVAATTEKLTGYERVATWDNGAQYWVYYRLNKRRHHDQLRRRANRALQIATTATMKGDRAHASDEISRALQHYITATKALNAERDALWTVQNPDSALDLLESVAAKIQAILDGLHLSSPHNVLTVRSTGRDKAEFSIRAVFTSDNLQQIPVRSFPIQVLATGQNRWRQTRSTDPSGSATFNLPNIPPKLTALHVEARPDLLSLIANPSAADSLYLERLVIPGLKIQLQIERPCWALDLRLRNLGEPVLQSPIENEVHEILNSAGIQVCSAGEGTALELSLEADTRKGTEMNGLATAFLDLQMKIRDLNRNATIASKGLSNLNGVDLDFESAGLAAHRNSIEKLRSVLTELIADVQNFAR